MMEIKQAIIIELEQEANRYAKGRGQKEIYKHDMRDKMESHILTKNKLEIKPFAQEVYFDGKLVAEYEYKFSNLIMSNHYKAIKTIEIKWLN